MSQHFSRQSKDSRPARPPRSRDGSAAHEGAADTRGRRTGSGRPQSGTGSKATAGDPKRSRDNAGGPQRSRGDAAGRGAAAGRAGGAAKEGSAKGSRSDARSGGAERLARSDTRSRSAENSRNDIRSRSADSPRSGSRSGGAERPPRSDSRRPQETGDTRRPRAAGRPESGRADNARPRRSDNVRTANDAAPRSGVPASAQERYPKADFARREGMLEGLPAVMVVNRSLKDYPFCKEFPWCLRLAAAYRADEASGLPLPKEERVLEAFEQNLFGLLKKWVNGHYVGHTDWSGTREFIFYVDDGGEAEDPLNAFGEHQKRELEFELSDDPRWQIAAHYFDYRD